MLDVARPDPSPALYFLQRISSTPRRNLQGYWFENTTVYDIPSDRYVDVSRCHVYYYYPGDGSTTAFSVVALYTV
jgi:hypothetical protein